jgi:hypothetical protein
MQGYRIGLCDYLQYGKVFVYCVVFPHVSADVQSVMLPGWIASKFRANWRLHTVITNEKGEYLEENERVA